MTLTSPLHAAFEKGRQKARGKKYLDSEQGRRWGWLGENTTILGTPFPDGKYAMGVYAPGPAPRDARGPTYGRWNMKDAQVVKWNCVFRLQNPDGLLGDYSCHMFVAVGSLEDVRTTPPHVIAAIHYARKFWALSKRHSELTRL